MTMTKIKTDIFSKIGGFKDFRYAILAYNFSLHMMIIIYYIIWYFHFVRLRYYLKLKAGFNLADINLESFKRNQL